MTKKEFDCVRMMRDIRDKLSERYQDREVQRKALERVRRKYGFYE